jgi:ankyrin repeat protein
MPEHEKHPLWNALFERNLPEARRLIAARAPLDDIIEEDGDTFLHRAAQDNDIEMVEFFFENDCPKTIESFDYIAQTPLIRASAHGRTDIVVRLLSAGSNPNAQDEERIGNTALHKAVRGGHIEIVSLLLRAGGNPTIPGWMALTAVDQAYYEIEGGLDSTTALQIQQMLASFPSLLRDKKQKAKPSYHSGEG